MHPEFWEYFSLFNDIYAERDTKKIWENDKWKFGIMVKNKDL